MVPAFDYVTTFHDAEADALFGGIVQDIEAGYTKSVAFVMPPDRSGSYPSTSSR